MTMGQRPFETVMEAHHGEIYRYLLRVTSRPSEAEDLSQETFLRAFRAYRVLSPDSNVRAWLFTIATNLMRNHWRSERRRRLAHAGFRDTRPQPDGADPENESLFNEAWVRLDRVVRHLPLKQRVAFVLRKVHEFDYDAIAENLACSTESARAHVFQALKKVRRGLSDRDLATEPRS
jgi:RNA polymerase sigma-70 factor (ECF subfamily)